MKKAMNFISFCTAAVLLSVSGMAYAQADIEIGKTTIRLQSPVKVYTPKDNDDCRVRDNMESGRSRRHVSEYMNVFFGFSFPLEGCSYEPTPLMPVKYGNSFEITFGLKQWFQAGHYAFGLSFQYSHYDYRGKGLASSGLITQYPAGTIVNREIFKTDNFGLGLYHRFYFSLRSEVYMDLGAWGDWAFSRQYKVKYFLGDSKEVDHYRDGDKFLPLQGGVYAALGINVFSVYCKYRFTNMFRHSSLPYEPPRMSIGLMIEL